MVYLFCNIICTTSGSVEDKEEGAFFKDCYCLFRQGG